MRHKHRGLGGEAGTYRAIEERDRGAETKDRKKQSDTDRETEKERPSRDREWKTLGEVERNEGREN